jgi:hypothetical protein
MSTSTFEIAPIAELRPEPLRQDDDWLRVQLAKQISTFLEAVETFNAKCEELSAIDAGVVEERHIKDAQSMPGRAIKLLREKIRLLGAITTEYVPAFEAAHRDRREAAFQKMEETKARVREALIGIGYLEGPITPEGNQHLLSITTDTIGRHPDVFRAMGESQALAGENLDLGERYQAALDQAKQQLDDRVKRAMRLV